MAAARDHAATAASGSCARCRTRTGETSTGLRLVARGLGIDWPVDESLRRVAGPARRLDRAAGGLPRRGDGAVPRRRIHRVRRQAPRSRSSTPRWRRRTRTSPRRCADWSTGMRPRRCLALTAGDQVPGWVVEGLPALPAVMEESGRRAERTGARRRRADGGRGARGLGWGRLRGGRGRRAREGRRHGHAQGAGGAWPGAAATSSWGPRSGCGSRRPTRRSAPCAFALAGLIYPEHDGRVGRAVASGVARHPPRNVRAPQGRVVGNAHPG